MRRRILLLAFAAVTAAAVLSACGGGADSEDAGGATTGTAETQPSETQPSETQEEAGGDPAAGAEVFATAGCGGCHTLSEAGSTGMTGPNLDARVPEIDEERIIDQVTNGGQNMPAFGDRLEEQQIRDVAAYLVDATSGGDAAGGAGY